MKVILHVGTHKTGSTALQRFLHQHSSVLLEHGILYPLPFKDGSHAHVLEDYLSPDQLPHRYPNAPFMGKIAEVLSSAPRAQVMLVSSEELGLHLMHADRARQLCEDLTALPGVDSLEVVVYLRYPVGDFVTSVVQQTLKKQNSLEYLLYHGLPYLDYRAYLEHWRQASGGRCTVRVFHSRHLKHGDIVDDFVSTFLPQVEWLCEKKAPPQNASLPSESLLFLWAARAVARLLRLRLAYHAAHDVKLPCGWEGFFGDFHAAIQALGASRFRLPDDVLAYLERQYPANNRICRGEKAPAPAPTNEPPVALTLRGLFAGVRWGRMARAVWTALHKAWGRRLKT